MGKLARRTFLNRTTTALTALGIAPFFAGCKSQNKNLNGMFVHHVFFWLKDADNPDVQAKFRSALEKLATIETIRYKHIGIPASTNRPIIDNTYTFSLLVAFDDEKGHEVYQEHPVHDEFREIYHEYWEKVLIFDTE